MRTHAPGFAIRIAVVSLACVVLAGCPADEETAGSASPPAAVAAAGAAGGAEGEVCGGIRGLACAEPLWCDPDPGNCRGADIQGTCVATLPMCTRDYRPVCGCDGKTYGNECGRRAARVAKDHDGECQAAGG